MDSNDTEMEKVIHIHQTLWRPCEGGGPMSPVWILKCLVSVFITACRLLLIVGFAITVTIWPREVVSCRDFILCAVATFWAMSLVGIYPGRASLCRRGWPRGFAKLNPSPHSWNIYFHLSGFQSSLLFIHFHYGPANTHWRCAIVWHRCYCDAPLSRLCSITEIVPKSPFLCVNRSALSGLVFMPAQELSSIMWT